MLNAALDQSCVPSLPWEYFRRQPLPYCFEVLTRVLSNGNDEANFNDIFSIFRDIMELISSNRFLDEAEINRIDVLCTDFGAKFPIYFPNRNITRNIYELVISSPIL